MGFEIIVNNTPKKCSYISQAAEAALEDRGIFFFFKTFVEFF